jgi:lipopolysaccharide transport system ATP-binding protein
LPTTSNADNAVAIRCEGLGKRYRIGEQVRYRTLRESVTDAMRAPLQWLGRQRNTAAKREATELWALRDLNLEVKHGEVLGLIGRNGSGKSTLLKVLSRITKPTEGYAEIRGRVGTLLEVGAGFHPELTGRENVFLNGAILGMGRREIERKFDEIVEFSDCGRMLDTPMKHYSSGMYVRLAFAVAAHLETEILFVDEVLAVGDAAFQKKCLGKINDVAHQGRTVLFVSHNMLAVESLCTRAICLHDGKVVLEGAPGNVTSRYLQNWMPRFNEVLHEDFENAPGNETVRLRSARVRAQNAVKDDHFTVQTPLVVEFEYWKLSTSAYLDLGVEVFNEHGVNVFTTAQIGEEATPAGLVRSAFVIPGDLLNTGTYWIHLSIVQGAMITAGYWQDLIAFEVHDAPSELRGHYHDAWPGALRPNLQWTTEVIERGAPNSAAPEKA